MHPPKPQAIPLGRVLRGFLAFRILLVILAVAFSAVYTYTRLDTPTPVHAATSSNLNFQARLLNAAGNTVPDGYYNISFNLYNVSSGGASLWSESYYDSNGVTAGNDNRVRVVNGYLSVNLASQTAFPNLNWDQDMWLTMNVGGSAQTATPTYDGEMTPRIKLTAVPYAFQAKQAEALNLVQGANTGTLNFTTLTGNRDIFLPDANGTVCLQSATACGFAATSGSTSYIQNSTSLQASANLHIQAADSTTTGTIGGTIRGAAAGQTVDLFQLQGSNGTLLTAFQADGKLVFGPSGAQDTNLYRSAANMLATDDSFTLFGTGSNLTVQGTGTSSFAGTLSVTGDVSIGTNSSLKLAGGTTFPVSPSEGQVYYRSDTDQLYVYTGAKWQADRTTATKIVAASDSQNKEKADYVADGSDDEVEINAAISALPATGGIVYLLEGTYTIDDSVDPDDRGIEIDKSNVTLTGSGANSVIKLKNSITGGNIDVIADNSGSTLGRITISNLKIDGNKANNASGTQNGIVFSGVGAGSGSTATPGVKIEKVWVEQVRSNGIELSGSSNGSITNSTVLATGTTTGDRAIYLGSSSLYNIVTGNTVQGNTGIGIHMNLGSNNSTITNNTVQGNGSYGIGLFSTNNQVSGNYVATNADGINASSGQNTITGNTFNSNTGDGIDLGSDQNTITGNQIISSGLHGIGLGGGSDNNTIAGNQIINSGTSTTSSSGISVAGGSNYTNITGNVITDTAGTGYAITITSGTGTYLADNTYSGTGASSINDTGTGTIYGGQLSSTNSFVLQGPGSVNIGQTSAGSGTLSVTGAYYGSQIVTPSAPTATRQGASGTTTWKYKITALDGMGETSASVESTGITNGAATLNATDFVRVTWNRVPGATSYKIYRTTAGGTPISTGLIGTINASSTTMQLDDTGLAATTAAPTANTTGGGLFAGDLAVNGSSLTSMATTFNLLQSNVTTLNIGAAVGAGGINLAGGSGSTGCTIDGSTGNLTCSGNITGNATGTVGYFSRSGTIIQPATAGDSIQTSGNLATTGTGTVTSAGLLTGQAGLTVTSAGSSLSGGIIDLNVSSNFATNINTGTSTGAVTIGNTAAGAISIQSGSGGINLLPSGASNTGVTIRPTISNSTELFRIRNQADTGNLFVADGINSRIGINVSGSVLDALHVNGALRLSGTGTSTFTTPVGSNVGTRINIPLQDLGGFEQILAFGLTSLSDSTARGISVFDARTVAHQPSIGVFNPGETDILGFSWEGSNGTGYIKSLGADIAIRTNTTDIVTFSGSTQNATFNGDVGIMGGDLTTNSVGTATLFDTNATTINIGGAATAIEIGATTGTTSINHALKVDDNTTLGNAGTDLITLQGQTIGAGSATATTGTTEATLRSNVTTVTLTAAGSFVNNDVIFIDNVGQDYYTRIVSGGGTTTLTVSPAVSYDASATVTKYNVQNIGATITDYTSLNNRFFQGYFLGGIVAGAGSTHYADGSITLQGDTNLYRYGLSQLKTDDNFLAGINITARHGQASSVSIGSNGPGGEAAITFGSSSDATIYRTAADTLRTGRLLIQPASNGGAFTVNNAGGFLTFEVDTNAGQVNSKRLAIADGNTLSAFEVTQNGTGSIFEAHDGGTLVASIADGGAATFKNSTNSTTAFQIQNAAGASLFTVDTVNQDITISAGGTTGTGEAALIVESSVNKSALILKSTDGINTVEPMFLALGDTTADKAFQTKVAGETSGRFSLNIAGAMEWGGGGGAARDTNLYRSAANTLQTDDTFIVGGAASTASATIFQVQNTASASLLTVDTLNSNISILGNNSGTLQSWITNGSSGLSNRREHSSVTANGYIYIIGGSSGGATSPTNTAYYGKANADGSVGTWSTTSTLPAARADGRAVYANGYIYYIGGEDSTPAVQSSVYYAKVNSDGTLGTWSTSSATGLGARSAHTAAVTNGYIYVMGGETTPGGTGSTTVYYAKLNADGSVGNWATAAALAANRTRAASVTANGYIYIIGGSTGTNRADTIYYAKPALDGTISAWTDQVSNKLLAANDMLSAAVANGYVYTIGGQTGASTTEDRVAYAPLNADGSTGAWAYTTSLPGLRHQGSVVVLNGYIYQLEGSTGAALQSTVYYTSTSRLKIGGSLDLVGYSGENLAEGGSAGSLTAGNTHIAGSLQVQDMASFTQGVSIDKELMVGGSLAVEGNWKGATVVNDKSAEGGDATYTESRKGLAYYLSSNSGSVNANITTTFNITGLSNTEGSYAFIHTSAGKAATLLAQSKTTSIQINGTPVSNINSGGSTLAAATQKEAYIIMYINGAWRVMGYGADTANGAAGGTFDTVDFAEWIPYSGSIKPQPGEVLTVGDADVSAKQSDTPYDSGLIGVVSTSPYQTAGADDGHSVIIALTGRVPVKVNLENGPIAKGDYLTSSSTPGVAMKAIKPGNIIGTALSSYNGTEPNAQVTVQLRNGYADPGGGSAASQLQGDQTISGNLNVSGDTFIGGDLTVADTITASNLVVTGSSTLANLKVTGIATVQDLTVAGTANISKLVVGGEAIFQSNITVGGHIVTSGNTPTGEVLGARGPDTTVTIEGNDNAGTITITTSSSAQVEGELASLIYNQAFGKKPVITLTPNSDSAANAQYYYESTPQGFKIIFTEPPDSGTVYKFSYFSIE